MSILKKSLIVMVLMYGEQAKPMALVKVCKEMRITKRSVAIGLILLACIAGYRSIRRQNLREAAYKRDWDNHDRLRAEAEAENGPVNFKKVLKGSSSEPLLKKVLGSGEHSISAKLNKKRELEILVDLHAYILKRIAANKMDSPNPVHWFALGEKIKMLKRECNQATQKC